MIQLLVALALVTPSVALNHRLTTSESTDLRSHTTAYLRSTRRAPSLSEKEILSSNTDESETSRFVPGRVLVAGNKRCVNKCSSSNECRSYGVAAPEKRQECLGSCHRECSVCPLSAGKYFKRKRACIAYMGSTVVDISIPSPFFKPVSLSLSRSPLF